MHRSTTLVAATGLALGLFFGTAGLAVAQAAPAKPAITGKQCREGSGKVSTAGGSLHCAGGNYDRRSVKSVTFEQCTTGKGKVVDNKEEPRYCKGGTKNNQYIKV